MFIGFEDHATIEQRRDSHGRRRIRIGVAIQIEHAAPCVIPLVIEVDDQVKPPMPAFAGVIVEIDVRLETLAMPVFMRAAAQIERVVDQSFNPGDRADEIEEFACLDDLVQVSIGVSKPTDAIDSRFAAWPTVIPDVVALLKIGELLEQCLRERRGQKAVDDHMAKGPCACKLSTPFPRSRTRLRTDDGSGVSHG